MFQLVSQCALLVFVYMSILFIIAQLKQDNSIVDVGWGMGFIMIAYFTLIKSGLYLPRHLLATLLVFIWGFRISGYILYRNWGKGEDLRYKKWRQAWQRWFYLRSYLQVFMLQGLLMLIISLPIIVINASTTPGLNVLDFLGLTIWLVGFYFEAVGDYQLYAFLSKKENRGHIMRYGLWKYTRHPNYFGEIVMWWAVWLIALNVQYGLWTIIGPIIITYLLVFVSGVPMTEKMFVGNPEYEEYKRTTSALIPWWPVN